MTLHLAALCLAGFGLVAALVSLLVAAALPALDRVAATMPVSHRATLWFGFSALPALVGVLAILASFFPSWGLAADHCLAHEVHHLHLCPHHLAGPPSVSAAAVALLVVVRVVASVIGALKLAWLSRRLSLTLSQAAAHDEGVWVYPGDVAEAFVVGALRPRIFASSALWALGDELSRAVIAHEKVHAAQCHPLWRILAVLFAAGHLPPVESRLARRLIGAQEFAADEAGARSLSQGRVRMAEALLTLARRQAHRGSVMCFADGNVRARVVALLGPAPAGKPWAASSLLASALVLLVVMMLKHDVVHHELETLLGKLG